MYAISLYWIVVEYLWKSFPAYSGSQKMNKTDLEIQHIF